MKAPIRIAITGAAGQIGYALVFRIASGQVFGPEQPVILNLVEITPALSALDGVVMELRDCAFPLVHDIVATDDLSVGFKAVNWALLVGGSPRKKGMERKELLNTNGKIFTVQGQALNEHAAPDIRVLVVGNPCNTNCLIAQSHAPTIPKDRWFAMTRLDENRAKAQLASKAGVPVVEVTNVAIWGNHSATQYPDFTHANISGRPVTAKIGDHGWLTEAFITTVQKRGAAVIEARGASSAASAASSIIDTVKSLIQPTVGEDWHSVAVYSDGSYGIDRGLIASFPVRTQSDGSWTIVPGLSIDDFSRAKIDATVAELREERAAVQELLGTALE